MNALDRQLAAVHIVLVAPRSAGNVGATARAMANNGLGRLVLVSPPAFDPDVARWMAPGAHDRIDHALIVGSVAEAIEALDAVRVVATSARARRLDTPTWSPPDLAAAVQLDDGPTAVVFGPEDYGLDNQSVARCDAVLRIPTAEHSSLNLAQAVNVTASSLRLLAGPVSPIPAPARAPARLRALLVDDLFDVLRDTTYFSGRRATPTRARITAAVAALSLSHNDIANARGMLKSLKHRLRATTPDT
jgi:TrmH family RNA methyltransferase